MEKKKGQTNGKALLERCDDARTREARTAREAGKAEKAGEAREAREAGVAVAFVGRNWKRMENRKPTSE